MKQSFLSVCIACGCYSSLALAAPDVNPDPAASVVYLRQSCEIANSDSGESPLENCFEDTASLKTWVYSRPDLSAKLMIDIGPGVFGPFKCESGDSLNNQGGDLTFRGAGVGKTVMQNTMGAAGAVELRACRNAQWAFESMTVKGAYGVVWIGRGQSNSIWTNVSIEGSSSSWYEQADAGAGVCEPGRGGRHMFFASRLLTTSGVGTGGFLNRCGDDWFWGSEITVDLSETGQQFSAIWSQGEGNRVHLYGTNVRIRVPESTSAASGTLTGFNVQDGAELHAHGVGLDVEATPGWAAVALRATNGAQIHANETSYFFGDTTGVAIQRILNTNAHVHAPFNWGPHPNVPAILSEDGADTAVVTTGTSDNHPHMVVYDSSCSSGWYDIVDRACMP